MARLEAPFLERNQRLIEEFILGLGALSQGRVKKYRYKLDRISRELGCPFEGVSYEDLKGFIEEINTSDLEEWTKRDYRLFVKKFFG